MGNWSSQYISQDQFNYIIRSLNVEDGSEVYCAMVLARATGALEADLSKRFQIPLVVAGGSTYSGGTGFASNLILSAMIAKIKELVGYDLNKTLTGTIDSTEKFINVYSIEYKDLVKTILDPGVVMGFQYAPFALDAKTPIQHIGLSKANNRTDAYSSLNWEDDEGF